VLARGLGTRMRAADPSAHLTEAQQRAADAGLKPMIPINGRPFLDYVLGALADAGIQEVALVVAPDHEMLRTYYSSTAVPSRIGVSFVVQDEPLGTANAIVAAETWTRGEPFLAMNADNLYPVAALADLVALDEPGLPAFERDELVQSSNIPPDRVHTFALIEIDQRGYLTGIVEKPSVVLPPKGGSHAGTQGAGTQGAGTQGAGAQGREVLISMNCWRFDSRIFAACRDVPRSARGELELPEAVGLAVRRGVGFRALRARGPVLDLSRRSDTSDVARRLAGRPPQP
jgi:glucose-1-phosphate thymidylyltransferase